MLTIKDIYTRLVDTGYQVSYGSLPEEGEIPLPYIVYYEENSSHLYADGVVFFYKADVTIELYTHLRDMDAEKSIEESLSDQAWSKDPVEDMGEDVYCTTYRFNMAG